MNIEHLKLCDFISALSNSLKWMFCSESLANIYTISTPGKSKTHNIDIIYIYKHFTVSYLRYVAKLFYLHSNHDIDKNQSVHIESYIFFYYRRQHNLNKTNYAQLKYNITIL